MKKEEIQKAIDDARNEWRAVRSDRLSRKKELIAPGCDISSVRRDRLYRELKKSQRMFAARIVHLERKMNRMRAREK
jgi:hypothetical protein